MKTILTFSLLMLSFVNPIFGQGDDEDQVNFMNMRNDDFTKLTGSQEGVKLNYSSEKTNVDGTAGIGLDRFLLQLSGSLGTTTNLSDLYKQNVLPTYAGSVTVHRLLPGTTWFFDQDFEENFDHLEHGDVPNVLSTPEDSDGDKYFEYREKLQYKVQNGKIKKDETLYTLKTFFWVSFTGKFDNAKYSFFDPDNVDFTNQITEPRYQSAGGKITLQYYMAWNTVDLKWIRGINYRPTFFYINGAIYRGLNNNISQLKKATIEDVTPATTYTAPGVTRQTIKSTTAYLGEYKQYVSTTASWEIILAPFKSFAINAFGEKNFIKKQDKKDFQTSDYSSIALGIYFFNNTKPSSVNFGVYCKWTQNHTSKARTNIIGIKASIPITPI